MQCIRDYNHKDLCESAQGEGFAGGYIPPKHWKKLISPFHVGLAISFFNQETNAEKMHPVLYPRPAVDRVPAISLQHPFGLDHFREACSRQTPFVPSTYYFQYFVKGTQLVRDNIGKNMHKACTVLDLPKGKGQVLLNGKMLRLDIGDTYYFDTFVESHQTTQVTDGRILLYVIEFTKR